MSGTAGAVAGANVAAVIAAHQHLEMLRKEEEDMTSYNKEDLDGWEFKIIRANTAYFKKPENLRKVCDEEAQVGWEMVEKFDNNRVRFKRKIECRKNDQFLDIDPYRSLVGIGVGAFVSAILVPIFLLIAAVAFFVVTTTKEISVPIYIFPIILIVIILPIAIAIKKSKG